MVNKGYIPGYRTTTNDMSVLGIIACSVLTNELTYLIRRDPEVNKVTIMDTPEGSAAADRLEETNACQVVELMDPTMLRSRSYRSDEVMVWVNPTDLHDSQERMRDVLTDQIRRMATMVDSILLLYGQCRCQRFDHANLESELGIPINFLTDRNNVIVDDCFAATMGSSKRYLQVMLEDRGTLFATPGYVNHMVTHQRKLDLVTILEEVEQLQMLLDYMGYHKVLKLDNLLDGDNEYHDLVDMFCRTFSLGVETMACNLAVFEDSYDLAKSSMHANSRGKELLDSLSVVWE
jgi:hypothetical protein